MHMYDLDDLHAAKGEIRINSAILIIMMLFSSLSVQYMSLKI